MITSYTLGVGSQPVEFADAWYWAKHKLFSGYNLIFI